MKKQIIITETENSIEVETEGFTDIELIGIYEFLKVKTTLNLNLNDKKTKK